MAVEEIRFGLSVALATPFRADGSLDGERLTEHALWCLDQGCQSVTAFGTTGEGPSLSLAERTSVLDDLAGVGVTGQRLVVAVITNAVGDAIEQTRQAYARGAQNVLLAPPFYFKPVTEDGILDWYRAVAGGLGAEARGILLYNIPSLTGTCLTVDLISRLRSALGPAIAGVKDSSCDWSYTEPLLRAHGDLAILVGEERSLAAAVRLGGAGSICGLANIFPLAVAGLLEGRDDPFVDGLARMIDGHPVVPAIKTLLASETGNEAWDHVRAPLEPLPPDEGQALVKGLQALKRNRLA